VDGTAGGGACRGRENWAENFNLEKGAESAPEKKNVAERKKGTYAGDRKQHGNSFGVAETTYWRGGVAAQPGEGMELLETTTLALGNREKRASVQGRKGLGEGGTNGERDYKGRKDAKFPCNQKPPLTRYGKFPAGGKKAKCCRDLIRKT